MVASVESCEMLRPLLKHGAARVWRAGLDALGYPPTWVDTTSEVMTILNELRG